MDERTRVLISLGAATAANCIPCFEHFFEKATTAGLTPEEVQGATEIGEQINKGAQMAIRKNINNTIFRGRGCGQEIPKSNKPERSCCG